jgi:hypothetical protein
VQIGTENQFTQESINGSKGRNGGAGIEPEHRHFFVFAVSFMK